MKSEFFRHVPLREEKLLFELSKPGNHGTGFSSTQSTVSHHIPEPLLREDLEDFPELSEFQVVRHFNRLASVNYCIDRGLFPLGSCTMKYNPRIHEYLARIPEFSTIHPYLPESYTQGCLHLMWLLQEVLKQITEMDAVTLQPAAGAHGELTGLLIMQAYFRKRGENRTTILVPDSAHGTNPASAAQCGFRVQKIPSDERGCLLPSLVRERLTQDVAGIMITNPNTLGFFEEDIVEICRLLHENGSLVYLDGANLNAFIGIASPARMGVDIMHLNLHKTFSTPHGGGGPGGGVVCVMKHLEPFLPVPRIIRTENGFTLKENEPDSIGRMKNFYGHFGIHIRALAYILTLGKEHLHKIAHYAVLNANYIRARLIDLFDHPYNRNVMHEVVLSDKNQKKFGVKTADIAKRLLDYGFHPPTIYFPLIIDGALMIEPTETESKEELDAFISALRKIHEEIESNPELVKTAPHLTYVRRLDEVRAARNPLLTWTSGYESRETP